MNDNKLARLRRRPALSWRGRARRLTVAEFIGAPLGQLQRAAAASSRSAHDVVRVTPPLLLLQAARPVAQTLAVVAA